MLEIVFHDQNATVMKLDGRFSTHVDTIRKCLRESAETPAKTFEHKLEVGGADAR